MRCCPPAQVIPVTSTLDWPQLGAIPESFGTAWGTLQAIGLERGRIVARPRWHLVGRHGGDRARQGPAPGGARDDAPGGASAPRFTRPARSISSCSTGTSSASWFARCGPRALTGCASSSAPPRCVDALDALAAGGRACITGYLEQDWDTERVEAEAQRRGVQLRHFGSGVINRESYTSIFQANHRRCAGRALHGQPRPRVRDGRHRRRPSIHGSQPRRRKGRGPPAAGLSARARPWLCDR